MTWQIAVPTPCALGESPFWHPHEQALYWVDIAARRVLRANVFMGTTEAWQLDQEPGCIAPATGGGLVLALRDGIWRGRDWGGALERIAPALHDTATTRFNDGKCDPTGRLWAGTIFEPRDRPGAALYRLDMAADAPALVREAGPATTANGLAFSPDGCTLYWADTAAHQVQAFDRDPADGTIGNPRTFLQFDPKPGGWQPGMTGYGGRPDGAAVDLHGNYWVAMYEGGRVLCVSPAGAILEDIAIPARCPTMPCFGGDDLCTLYVTTAREKRPADELAQFPASGCVFSRRVGVPGLPVNAFAG